MVYEITSLCDKHGIVYSIANITQKKLCDNIKGIDDLWIEPAVIMMPRNDCVTRVSVSTARITHIRDDGIRLLAENKMNSGFFANVIPLDDYNESEEAARAFIALMRSTTE